MECPKCNSQVRKSQFYQLTGYESFRCTNNKCNSLFDISDFNPEINNDKLSIKNNNCPYLKDYLQILLEQKSISLAFMRKRYFLENLLSYNKKCILVVSSNHDINRFNHNQEILGRIIPYHYFKKEYEHYNGKYNFFIIDEQHSKDRYEMIKNLSTNDKEKFYYIYK